MYDQLVKAIDERSAEIYTKEQWTEAHDIQEQTGLNFDLNEMCNHVLGVLFEEKPYLFQGIRWMNDDSGMPIWVRPGVEWQLDTDYEED
jgi:hypothetical protein